MNRLAVFPLLLALLFVPDAAAQRRLNIDVELQPISVYPEMPAASSSVQVTNSSGFDVPNVELEVTLKSTRPATLSVASLPRTAQWNCTNVDSQRVRCTIPTLDASRGVANHLEVTITPGHVGRLELAATLSWTWNGVRETAEANPVTAVAPREIAVTNTNDAGPGSFRAAIEEANATCAADGVPCRIAFRLTEPPAGAWHTIVPLTPLPVVTAPDIDIAGTLRSAPGYVELDGSLLTAGNALEIAGQGYWRVYGFAIGGFPGDGVVVRRPAADSFFIPGVTGTLVGVRPDMTPRPNRGRGIVLEAPTVNAEVAGSFIAANVRSGISIAGATRILIEENFIGRHLFMFNPPPGNGASGIAVLPGSSDVTVIRCVIVGNAQFGIAIARGTQDVKVRNTKIHGNGVLDIDHFVDGFSGYFATEADATTSRLPAPLITSVTHDPETNTVIVSGIFDAPDPDEEWQVTLVGDRAFPAWPDHPLPEHTFTGRTFSFAAPIGFPFEGTLRAYVNSRRGNTVWSASELSEAAGIDRRRRRSVR